MDLKSLNFDAIRKTTTAMLTTGNGREGARIVVSIPGEAMATKDDVKALLSDGAKAIK